jgi:hypothetical protein
MARQLARIVQTVGKKPSQLKEVNSTLTSVERTTP